MNPETDPLIGGYLEQLRLQQELFSDSIRRNRGEGRFVGGHEFVCLDDGRFKLNNGELVRLYFGERSGENGIDWSLRVMINPRKTFSPVRFQVELKCTGNNEVEFYASLIQLGWDLDPGYIYTEISTDPRGDLILRRNITSGEDIIYDEKTFLLEFKEFATSVVNLSY